MSRVYVDFAGLEEIGQECEAISSRLDTIQSDFQHTIRSLDWDIRFQSDINRTAAQISRRTQEYHQVLKTYRQFIDQTCQVYRRLDAVEYEKTLQGGGTGSGAASSNDRGQAAKTSSHDLIRKLSGAIGLAAGYADYTGADPGVSGSFFWRLYGTDKSSGS